MGSVLIQIAERKPLELGEIPHSGCSATSVARLGAVISGGSAAAMVRFTAEKSKSIFSLLKF
jgi:hypothetical protein